MCEILDDLKMKFETHHDIYLPAGQCWHWIFTLKKSQKKFAVNNRDPRRARWDFRDLLDDSLLLYLKFGMNTYLKYWGNYKVLQMKLGDLLLLLLLFIGALRDPARHCYDFIREFGFLLYWLFHTYSSQFVLMCFCVYIHILPLCCVPHLLIFLKCSLAFVILPVSTLLPFMLLFSEPCLLFYYSPPTEDSLVFCLPIVCWWW